MSLRDFLTGLFRRTRSRVLRREVEVVGRCQCCGGCCRSIHLSDRGRWLRRMAQYERLVAEAPEYVRFRPAGRGDQGFLLFDCALLGEDNLCTAHDTRPALCRNYPSKSLYYRGGTLPGDCGYSFRAATFRDALFGRKPRKPADFSAVLRREIQQDKDKQT
ncbi:YkgJ family cysteine cluster protein [Desulfovibrio caledoniensis]